MNCGEVCGVHSSEGWCTVPGWEAGGRDADGLQHATGSELLHCPLGVKPGHNTISQQPVSSVQHSPSQSDQKRRENQQMQTQGESCSREGVLEVIGLDAADVVGCGCIQGLH